MTPDTLKQIGTKLCTRDRYDNFIGCDWDAPCSDVCMVDQPAALSGEEST